MLFRKAGFHFSGSCLGRSFFGYLLRLYSLTPVKAGYGNKWPS
jgi:hypothetical protein